MSPSATHSEILEQYNLLLTLSLGAVYREVDLHIHTPGSRRDYKFHGQLYEKVPIEQVISEALAVGLYTKEQFAQSGIPQGEDKDRLMAELIVLTAARKGLSAIAITDHDTCDWYPKIVTAYEQLRKRFEQVKPLAIFPGVEITSSSQHHIIAIFDPPKWKESWEKLHSAIYDQETGESYKSESDVVDAIEACGAIAYLPHFDTAENFRDMFEGVTSSTKARVLKHKALLAIGFRQYEMHRIVRDELTRRGPYHREVPPAFIQDSDAHDIDEIGCRPVSLKLDTYTFTALKYALREPGSRVAPKHPPARVVPRFLGVAMSGGWFTNDRGWTRIRFSSGLSVIVGGRGTGKSTILKVMRAALNRFVDDKDEKLFLSSFTDILVFFEFEGEHCCAALSPSPDVYDIKSTSINEWVDTYWIYGNHLEEMDYTQWAAARKRLIPEVYSQSKLAQVASNPTGFEEFFDQLVCLRDGGQAYSDLLDREKQILLHLESLGRTFTNSFAQEKLTSLRQQLSETRRDIQIRRHEMIKLLNLRAKNRVKLELSLVDHRDALFEGLAWVARGAGHSSDADRFTSVAELLAPLDPTELTILLARGDHREILRQSGTAAISEKDLADALRFFTENVRYVAERALVLQEDYELRVLFNCSRDRGVRGDIWRPLQHLSYGQRAVAVTVLVTESNAEGSPAPLIIDQPEDSLDNAFLHDNLVRSLRRIKARRQVILVTHSPTIVAGADADQVICLSASDICGWVQRQGSLDNLKVQQFVVDTLEGTKDALLGRVLKYEAALDS